MRERHKEQERGGMVVMFSLYTVGLMSIVAIAVNVYLIGNALIQQRNAAEYVAMAVLKVANDPAMPFAPACNANEAALLNCIFERATVAGQVSVGFSNDYYLPGNKLVVVPRDSACPELPGSGAGADGSGGDNNDDDDDGDEGDGNCVGPNCPGAGMNGRDFCWPRYKVADERFAEVVLGQYTPPTENSKGKFIAAELNDARDGKCNAIKLRFHLDEGTDVKVISPLISLFGRNIKLKLSSGAIAYRTGAGTIALAMDPYL